jgi:translation elongation factor EF-Ts
MTSDIYFDRTELKGEQVKSAKINIYSTVQENNSLSTSVRLLKSRKCPISTIFRMTTNIGVTVDMELYANPIR